MTAKLSTHLVLASTSPRRKALLQQIGLNFRVSPSSIDEPPYTGKSPVQYASELAELKASAISKENPDALVIGADTIVVVDDQVLGKPVDPTDAQKMLKILSGRSHEVITAYSLQYALAGIIETRSVTTDVYFRDLEQKEIDIYIRSGDPFDKAGSYGIQDFSGVFVERIDGCFYNVVGFPISDFHASLKDILQKHNLILV